MFLFILAIWGTQALQILGWPKKLFTSLFFHHMEKLWSLDAKSWLIGKDRDAGKDWEQKEKGVIEDEMLGCYYWLSGHEFEQAPGDREGQGSLVCWSYWVMNSWTWLSHWTTTNEVTYSTVKIPNKRGTINRFLWFVFFFFLGEGTPS